MSNYNAKVDENNVVWVVPYISKDIKEAPLIVKAKSIKDITYYRYGKATIVPTGTDIVVNIETNIASNEQDSFDIFFDEYVVSYVN